MSDAFRFWVHGVNVIPEYTKAYTGHDNGLYMRPTGYGTIIIMPICAGILINTPSSRE